MFANANERAQTQTNADFWLSKKGHNAGKTQANADEREQTLADFSDIFNFFFRFRGREREEESEARGGGRVSRGGGGDKYVFSGPKCPPRNAKSKNYTPFDAPLLRGALSPRYLRGRPASRTL